MLEYIIGRVKSIGQGYLIIENNGIGYRVLTSSYSGSKFIIGDEHLVYLHLAVREDALTLYGFSDEEELEIFKLLISVSSIGPKNALSILSELSVMQIIRAIQTNGIDTLSKAPGVGKKTASRIILELTDKVAKMKVEDSTEEIKVETVHNDEIDSAIDALVSLGYIKADVNRVISKLNVNEMGIEEIIKSVMLKLS